MHIEKRSVGLAIFLSIITCGIYMIYWEYVVIDSLYKANKMPSTAGMDVVLSIVTCGIYGLYMLYKAGKLESGAHTLHELPPKDDSILYILLGIFGLAIVSFAILQNNINTSLVDRVNGPANNPEDYDPQRRPY